MDKRTLVRKDVTSLLLISGLRQNQRKNCDPQKFSKYFLFFFLNFFLILKTHQKYGSHKILFRDINMAIRLDGKQIAAEIRGNLKEKVDEIRKTVPDFSPGLAIVQESF